MFSVFWGVKTKKLNGFFHSYQKVKPKCSHSVAYFFIWRLSVYETVVRIDFVSLQCPPCVSGCQAHV